MGPNTELEPSEKDRPLQSCGREIRQNDDVRFDKMTFEVMIQWSYIRVIMMTYS